jgi:outer membrane protein assembly factor BamB/dienelactone hydrolase
LIPVVIRARLDLLIQDLNALAEWLSVPVRSTDQFASSCDGGIPMPASSRPLCCRSLLTLVALAAVGSAGRALGQEDGRRFVPPDDIAYRTADIISEGTRMSAEVFTPKDAGGKKLPTVILCHGWGGVAAQLRPEAIAFARAGYLAVTFDYRGWGSSDARLVLVDPDQERGSDSSLTMRVKPIREVVDPLDQTTDLQNAVHWVQGENQCDTSRIGLWGSSYSGGHVVHVAARDRRVKAVVAQVPALDSRWVVATPLARRQTLAEATRRARGNTGYPEPGTGELPGLKGAPIRERMMSYAPVDDVSRADQCAMLFILAEKEELFDNKDHGIKAFERAKGPRKLVTLSGITHYGVYGEKRAEAQREAIAWFDAHLKATEPADRDAAKDKTADTGDWSMYNVDVRGTRHNSAETTLSAATVPSLTEKWRFPAQGADLEIGAIHATPSVVDGFVYFGTATDPAFYRLDPQGKLVWTYRNTKRGGPLATVARAAGESFRNIRFQSSENGIMSSALVTGDTVYFGDLGGWFYALDRETGKERWTLDSRAKDFPGAHPFNCSFASPILVEGKLIVAGGALEQVLSAVIPGYRKCTGRGFVMALDPTKGAILWKHDVGPKPKPLEPPVTIDDSWGKQVFHVGPATSVVWSTPSYDAETHTIFFGTDVNTAPRQPTPDNPRLDTPESCAVVALDARDGSRKWVTQLSAGDVWNNAMRSYDPKEGRYKDQAVGDTPKIYTIDIDGTPTKVVGVGCKNGGFYVLCADDGRILAHTPIYTGPPAYPLDPEPDPRLLALPSAIGGLQSGCATDGASIYTNGIDAVRLASQEKPADSAIPPTGGRVVSLSLDTRTEHWRHERPLVPSLGGPAPKPLYTNVGDPVASGIALAGGVAYFTTVASGKLVALDAKTGVLLKEIEIGPVWSGPSVSRGHVYVGTGNTLFNPPDFEAYFPKRCTGTLHCFGLDDTAQPAP